MTAAPLFGPDPLDMEPEPPSRGAPGEAWAVRQYRGKGLRIGRNRTVHRVAFVEDERGMTIPAPDCHAGYYAAGRPWWMVYGPTTDQVNCQLCLHSHRPGADPARSPAAGDQLALDLGSSIGPKRWPAG
ncbi:hypothetical protein [Nocardia sp. NPDC004750]